MDPTANLTEQLELSRDILSPSGGGLYESEDDEGNLRHYGVEEYRRKCDRLAELVVSLHEWMLKGGYLPGQWAELVLADYRILMKKVRHGCTHHEHCDFCEGPRRKSE